MGAPATPDRGERVRTPGDVLADLSALETAQDALTKLVQMLELEPMGGRPDGRATWDDVIAYVAKALGTRTLALEAVKRRTAHLAAAVGLPEGDTPWPIALGQVLRLTEEAQATAQTRANLLELHQPRNYSGGGYHGGTVRRCITCAVPGPNNLRRADWPCATAVALGVTE